MQSCHYAFTCGSNHTVKALCSDCLPSHHKLPLSRSPFCHRPVMLCPAAEARRKDADGADGSEQVGACCGSFRSGASATLWPIVISETSKMHTFAPIPSRSGSLAPASTLRSEPILELLSEALFRPYCSWRLAPDDPPPLLTSPGLQIKREQAISWADNGTWHLCREVKHTQSPRV